MRYPATAYECIGGCGAEPGEPCRSYMPWARPGEWAPAHASRRRQQARGARPPGIPPPERPVPVLYPYARAGLNQAD